MVRLNAVKETYKKLLEILFQKNVVFAAVAAVLIEIVAIPLLYFVGTKDKNVNFTSTPAAISELATHSSVGPYFLTLQLGLTVCVSLIVKRKTKFMLKHFMNEFFPMCMYGVGSVLSLLILLPFLFPISTFRSAHLVLILLFQIFFNAYFLMIAVSNNMMRKKFKNEFYTIITIVRISMGTVITILTFIIIIGTSILFSNKNKSTKEEKIFNNFLAINEYISVGFFTFSLLIFAPEFVQKWNINSKINPVVPDKTKYILHLIFGNVSLAYGVYSILFRIGAMIFFRLFKNPNYSTSIMPPLITDVGKTHPLHPLAFSFLFISNIATIGVMRSRANMTLHNKGSIWQALLLFLTGTSQALLSIIAFFFSITSYLKIYTFVASLYYVFVCVYLISSTVIGILSIKVIQKHKIFYFTSCFFKTLGEVLSAFASFFELTIFFYYLANTDVHTSAASITTMKNILTYLAYIQISTSFLTDLMYIIEQIPFKGKKLADDDNNNSDSNELKPIK